MDAILEEINRFNASEKEKKNPSSKRRLNENPDVIAQSRNQMKHNGQIDSGTLAGKWSFTTDYNDHFETPEVAYFDIYNVLSGIAAKLNKPVEDLIIYDPYYCDGAMKATLLGIGFRHVINENRDFYADIARGVVPDYDVMVTNPPYSADHKLKLLDYLNSSTPGTGTGTGTGTTPPDEEKEYKRKDKGKGKGKSTHNKRPFLLLLPIYLSTKSYWRGFVSENSSNTTPEDVMDAYYIVPPDSYSYMHPEGTGKDKSPFFSCWFLGICGLMREIDVCQCAKSPCSYKTKEKFGVEQRKVRAYASADQLVARGYVTEKRANPKQRKKAKGLVGGGTLTANNSNTTATHTADKGTTIDISKCAGSDGENPIKKKKKRY